MVYDRILNWICQVGGFWRLEFWVSGWRLCQQHSQCQITVTEAEMKGIHADQGVTVWRCACCSVANTADILSSLFAAASNASCLGFLQTWCKKEHLLWFFPESLHISPPWCLLRGKTGEVVLLTQNRAVGHVFLLCNHLIQLVPSDASFFLLPALLPASPHEHPSLSCFACQMSNLRSPPSSQSLICSNHMAVNVAACVPWVSAQWTQKALSPWEADCEHSSQIRWCAKVLSRPLKRQTPELSVIFFGHSLLFHSFSV